MFAGLASFVQVLLDAIAAALGALCALFPPSPFVFIEGTEFSSLITQINYFIPVYEFVSIGEGWLIAVGVYYLISIAARWLKAID